VRLNWRAVSIPQSSDDTSRPRRKLEPHVSRQHIVSRISFDPHGPAHMVGTGPVAREMRRAKLDVRR
jgi:hypothetical protein